MIKKVLLIVEFLQYVVLAAQNEILFILHLKLFLADVLSSRTWALQGKFTDYKVESILYH